MQVAAINAIKRLDSDDMCCNLRRVFFKVASEVKLCIAWAGDENIASWRQDLRDLHEVSWRCFHMA